MTIDSHARTMTPLQGAAAAVGTVFLLVGVAGFIPGLTSNLDALEIAGHESDAKLLGLFEVSVLHNLIHLAFGVAGLVLARTWSGAKAFLIYGGVLYLVVAAYGWLVDHGDDANFVPFNEADNWLHVVLGVGMVALGGVLAKPRT